MRKNRYVKTIKADPTPITKDCFDKILKICTQIKVSEIKSK